MTHLTHSHHISTMWISVFIFDSTFYSTVTKTKKNKNKNRSKRDDEYILLYALITKDEDESSGEKKKTYQALMWTERCYSFTDDVYRRAVNSFPLWTGPESNSWFSTPGRGGSKLGQWGNHLCRVDEVPVLPSLCHPSPINQTPNIHFLWLLEQGQHEKTQQGRRIGLPRSFQPCSKQLNITTVKSHGGLPLQRERPVRMICGGRRQTV